MAEAQAVTQQETATQTPPDHLFIFSRGLQCVLEDPSFKIKSPANQCAVRTASALSVWCLDTTNHEKLADFVRVLTLRLTGCFTKHYTSLKLRREKMWEAYHQLRTAQTFRDSWETFLQQSVGCNTHPAFYQHVTHSIFKELIEWEFFVPPQTTPEDEHPNRPLSFVELNALRYVAGYICRKVKKQLDTSSLPFKDDMVHCIMHLAGDEVDCEETESWVNAIDRGGLWHVSDSTHSLFVILEQQTRRFFSTKSHHVREQQKDIIVSALMSDNDVLFQWCLLTTMINDDIARSLLEKIVQLYVTVRGFAFATSWLEMYKQSTKKNIQKKKALRKELHPSADV